jgi:Fic family protein
MDYTELDAKLVYYRKFKQLIPEAVIRNYEDVFNVEYTHNSTAIEGNTLSLVETKRIVEDGISPNGRNMREIFEVFNHGKAYAYVLHCINDSKALDRNIVKEIHAKLMDNIIHGGIYRSVDVYISGAKHTPPPPDEAYRQLELFYHDMEVNRKEMHPIDYAAWTHAEFVKIHPFVDGNGRAARLFMNYQLVASGYLPVSIPVKRRLEYFDTLEAYACDANLESFAALVSELENKRLDQYIKAIKQLTSQEACH